MIRSDESSNDWVEELMLPLTQRVRGHCPRQPEGGDDEASMPPPPPLVKGCRNSTPPHLDPSNRELQLCTPPAMGLPALAKQESSSSVALANFRHLYSEENVGKICSEDSIQAMMVALAAEKQEEEQRRLEEEASAELVRKLMKEEGNQVATEAAIPFRKPPIYASKEDNWEEVARKSYVHQSEHLLPKFNMSHYYSDSINNQELSHMTVREGVLSNSTSRDGDMKQKSSPDVAITLAKKEPTLSRKCSDECIDLQCLVCHRSTGDCKMTLRKLPCKHIFCAQCIDHWLTRKSTCPYCRRSIPRRKIPAS